MKKKDAPPEVPRVIATTRVEKDGEAVDVHTKVRRRPGAIGIEISMEAAEPPATPGRLVPFVKKGPVSHRHTKPGPISGG